MSASSPAPAGSTPTSTWWPSPADDGVRVREGPGRAGRAGPAARHRLAGRRPGRRRPAAPPRSLAASSRRRGGRPGTGPVAFGALPFTPAAPAPLVVPEVVVGRAEDGTRWVTEMPDEARRRPRRPRPGGAAPCRSTAAALRGRARPSPESGAIWSIGPPRSWPAARSTRWSWPGRSTSPPTVPSTARPCWSACGPPTPAATSWASAGSWRPAPSCWCRWRRRGPLAPHGRHRPPGRRPRRRPAPGAVAAGLDQGPPGAPGHDRHGARHAARLVLLRRLRGRAVGGGGGQRPAPGHAGRGPPVPPRPRCWSWWRRCTPPRRWPAGPGGRRGLDRRARGHRPGPLRRHGRAGSTPPATAPGPCPSAAPRSTATGPGVRRQRHRGRQRSAGRAGRDPGQVPGPALRPGPSL